MPSFGSIASWVVGSLLLLLSLILLLVGGVLPGLIAIVGSILLLPFMSKHVKKKWQKITIITVTLLAILLGFGSITPPSQKDIDATPTKSAFQDQAETVSTEAANIDDYNACDFLPPEDAIPTEFRIGSPVEEDTACRQTYRQPAEFTTSFVIDIYKFDSKTNASTFYNEQVAEEKSNRGYTELTANEQCFALQREGNIGSTITLYCDWGHIVFVERVILAELFDTNELLVEIPKVVADKITELGFY